jgi:type III secretion protein Q
VNGAGAFPWEALPRLTRSELAAGRALAAALPLGAGPAFAALTAALGEPLALTRRAWGACPASEAMALARGAVLRADLEPGRSALLVIDQRLAPHLARRLLGVDAAAPELAAPRPPTVAECGALELLGAALLDGTRVRQVSALSPSECEAMFATRSAGSWLWAEAQLRTPVGEGAVRLLAPAGLQLAFAPRDAAVLLVRRSRLDEFTVGLAVEIGRTTIARGDLYGLGAGDVVLFEHLGVGPAGSGFVTLRVQRGGWRARVESGAATLIEWVQSGGGERMEAGSPPAGAQADALLRDLPVELVCELGRVTVSGRELLELEPGAVVPLGRPLAGPVDLCVGGRLVGHGELVDIEGEIGVRVVQLLL